MKILYGTTNKGKLQAMKTAVESLDIELIGLGDVDSELPDINENGKKSFLQKFYRKNNFQLVEKIYPCLCE